MTTIAIPLDSIDADDRLRRVDPAEVERIALSMSEVGQLQAIEVAPGQGTRYRLVVGAHRLAAARALRWETIEASVFDGDPDTLRLREIDENLYRRELSPFDQAAFLAERRDVCQRLGMLNTRGGARRGDQSAKLALWSFEDELAAKFGLGRRTVFRALRRKAGIALDVWARIAGTRLAEMGAALDALAAVPKAEQMGVLEWWLTPAQAGQARPSFAEMCRLACGGKAAHVAPSRDRRAALMAAWKAADAQDRAWLFSTTPTADWPALRGELERLLARLGWRG